MAKTLEEYTAEISKSYDNTRNALNKQINAIEGDLAKTQNQINTSFANQQATLDRQRNNAASAASMQAAGSGGSFGGAANIANKKYYENSFVPAQTSLQTNQANALENAKTAADNQRLNLQTQLAALEDEVSKAAQQRYYEALEADRQERLARAQMAAANSWGGYWDAAGGGGGGASPTWGRGADFGYSDKSGYYFHDANGNLIKANTYAKQTGQDIRAILNKMAQGGDLNAKRALAGLNNKKKQLTNEERVAFNVLGISTNGYGSRA